MAEIPDLGIPQVFLRTLEYLTALPADVFESLMSVIESLSPSLSANDAADQIGAVLPDGAGGSVTSLIQFAVSSKGLTSSFKTDIGTIAEALGPVGQ